MLLPLKLELFSYRSLLFCKNRRKETIWMQRFTKKDNETLLFRNGFLICTPFPAFPKYKVTNNFNNKYIKRSLYLYYMRKFETD